MGANGRSALEWFVVIRKMAAAHRAVECPCLSSVPTVHQTCSRFQKTHCKQHRCHRHCKHKHINYIRAIIY